MIIISMNKLFLIGNFQNIIITQIFCLTRRLTRASLLIPKSHVAVIPNEPRSAPVLSLRSAGFYQCQATPKGTDLLMLSASWTPLFPEQPVATPSTLDRALADFEVEETTWLSGYATF